MSRLNIFLLIVVMGCALSVVNATNQQRQIFIQLQRAQSQERQLQQDYSQLQYQQSALSKTSRIEAACDGLAENAGRHDGPHSIPDARPGRRHG